MALPTPRTRTPVAIGSSVPAWPTRRVREPADPGDDVVRGPAGRLVTTSRRPSGQALGRRRSSGSSSFAASCTGRRRRRRRRRPRRAATSASRAAAVARGASSMCAAVSGSASGMNSSDGVSRMPGCLPTAVRIMPLATLERRARSARVVVVARRRCRRRRVLEVAGHPDIGDRDEAEPRVLDAVLEHLGDDHLDAVGELAGAGGVRHGCCPPMVRREAYREAAVARRPRLAVLEAQPPADR